MAEYIDREAALMKLMQDGCSAKNLQSISDMPAADVAPVIHAHWVSASKKQGVNIGMKCSLCGARIKNSEFFNGNHNYCHKCGAKMDETVGNSDRLEENKE